MSSPINRAAAAAATLLMVGAPAAASDPCWECRAQACYYVFEESTKAVRRDHGAEEIAIWNEIEARADSLAAANAEHEAVMTELMAERDGRIEDAYGALLACLAP